MKIANILSFLLVAVVLISCAPTPSKLTAGNRGASTTQNTPIPITLIVTGGSANNLTYQVSTPAHGSLSGAAPNLTYTPAPDYEGVDQFTFSATDGTLVSNTATITIRIAAQPLTAVNQTVQTLLNTPVNITLGVTGSGALKPLDYQLGVPSTGTLSGTAPNLTYTPAQDYTGTAVFTFSVSSGSFPSNLATVTINVAAAAAQTTQPPPPSTTADPFVLPINLEGVAPEETTGAFAVTKPLGVTTAVLTLAVYDADFANEGELVINGAAPIPLFGADGVSANNNLSSTVVITMPASIWLDGQNTLTFRHLNTAGYIIDAIAVSFQ